LADQYNFTKTRPEEQILIDYNKSETQIDLVNDVFEKSVDTFLSLRFHLEQTPGRTTKKSFGKQSVKTALSEL